MLPLDVVLDAFFRCAITWILVTDLTVAAETSLSTHAARRYAKTLTHAKAMGRKSR